MPNRFSLADVAALVGEPTRAAMLLALLDGRALPAGELARAADLSAPATSLHLGKLTRGGLITMARQGRHHYFRLASSEVAHALEALGAIASAPPPARSLSPAREALRTARSCYDHLAGVLAIETVAMLERKRVLRKADAKTWQVSSAGRAWLNDEMGIDVDLLNRGERPLALCCLDWTERKPHVAGALGAAWLDALLKRRWVSRAKQSRALVVTPRGETELKKIGVRTSQ